MRRAALILATSLALALGCSDDSGTTYLDGSVLPDIGVGSEAGADMGTKDGAAADQAATKDSGPAASSALSLVVNKLTLPKSGNDYAVDIDNNGKKDNQLGNIMGALSALIPAGNSPQAALDSQIKAGSLILLFDVLAKSIVNATSMTLKMYMGADLDSNAADNFTGSEPFGISASSPTNLSMPGKIVSGLMTAGPGTMTIPIPLGITPTNVSLKKAQATGTLKSTGLTGGQINGAIPWSDVTSKLIPAMATMLDAQYKTADASLKALLKGLFDPNGDGKIEASEITGNILIGIFLKADVDTDGDKKMDAMSVGMGFTAVSCTIKN